MGSRRSTIWRILEGRETLERGSCRRPAALPRRCVALTRLRLDRLVRALRALALTATARSASGPTLAY